MAVRHGGDQALGRRAAAIAPGHVGGRAGLVEEDEACRVHEACQPRHRRRLAATSGRSCSAALRLFFCA